MSWCSNVINTPSFIKDHDLCHPPKHHQASTICPAIEVTAHNSPVSPFVPSPNSCTWKPCSPFVRPLTSPLTLTGWSEPCGGPQRVSSGVGRGTMWRMKGGNAVMGLLSGFKSDSYLWLKWLSSVHISVAGRNNYFSRYCTDVTVSVTSAGLIRCNYVGKWTITSWKVDTKRY